MKKYIFSAAFVLAMFLSASFAAQTSAQTIVINEVYGGGGNAGATFNADFIELYCVGPAACPLTGLVLQYASATGTFNTTGQIALPADTIPVGGYYLVQTTIPGATAQGAPLPTPDFIVPSTNQVNLSATSGNVILVNGALPNATACAAATNVIDRVGYGTGACFEGTAAPAGTNAVSLQRIPNGSDTNNNSVDFQAAAPTPKAMNVSATAAGATLEGRVSVSTGKGIPKAELTLTDSNGNSRIIFTDRKGNFRFEEVPTGETYILSVRSRSFVFAEPTRAITVNEDLDGIDFVAN